jgi:hypothetical protein
VPTIGWYSLDAIARYWDGVGFTTSAVCVNALPISLRFNTAAVGSCAATGTTYYIAGGETFATMTAIYTDAALTILAPNGYYSNGTNVRQWTAPTMGASVVCTSSTAINLGAGINSGSACSSMIPSVYYINSAYVFITAPVLYQDINLLIPVVIGYYSDGINVRYWDGLTLSTAIICVAGYAPYSLKTNSVLAGSCTSGVIRVCYILYVTGNDFPTATQIWNNSDGTGVPPIGYYSYGLDVRYWDGLILGPVQACPTATTPIFLSFGATAEASCLEPFTSQFWFPTVDLTWSNASSIGVASWYLYGGEFPPASGFYTDSTGTVRQWNSVTRSFLSTTTCATPPTSYAVNMTTDSWVDNSSACANYLTIDLELFSPDSVIIPGSTILYIDNTLMTAYPGLGLYHITSYGGIVSIVIEATGLVTEYGTPC